MHAIIWLILFIVLLAFEFVTMGLTTVWFAAGAMVAFFAAVFHATWWVQFLLFIIVSGVLLIFTRPFAVDYINRNTVKTNVESIVGSKARVIAVINNDLATGYVSVGGVEWAARSADGSIIELEEPVIVKAVEGVKLIVEREAKPVESTEQ